MARVLRLLGALSISWRTRSGSRSRPSAIPATIWEKMPSSRSLAFSRAKLLISLLANISGADLYSPTLSYSTSTPSFSITPPSSRKLPATPVSGPRKPGVT